jgi:ribosomal protein S21
MINIQIEKNNNENALNTLKRFTKRVQSAGILPRVRSLRYNQRNQSPLARKKRALTVMRRKEETLKLIKLGKIAEKMTR